jgi:hypothetical protein
MLKTGRVGMLIPLGVCLTVGVWLQAEEDGKVQTSPALSQKPPVQDKKAVLVDATRVSTDKVMEGASKRKPEGESAKPTPDQTQESAVTEFRPAPQDRETAEAKAAVSEGKKKTQGGPLKDVHGTVYGGAGSAGHSKGAAVGASTRGGKTSIYVEAEQERATSPPR